MILNARRPSLFALPLLLLALVVLPRDEATASPLDTITLTSPNNVTVAESDDYATQVLGDPWDMNNIEDIDFPYNFTLPTVSGGVWNAVATSGQASSIWLQYQNFDVTYSYLGEKDGVNYPINTGRFTHLRLRMYAEQGGQTVLWWFRTHAANSAGNSTFLQVQPGWHIYDLDLPAGGPGSNGNWTGEGSIAGLRLDAPWFTTNNDIQFDWARLTPATGQSVSIAWNYSSNSSPTVNLYLSTSPDANQDNEHLITSVPASSRSYTWTGTGMAPGTYYIHASMNGAVSSSGPLTISAAPLVRIDAPSQLSGEDYAQAQLATSWEGGNSAQFARKMNVNNVLFTPSYMQASATNNDPELWWTDRNFDHPVDTDRYRYFNIRMWIQAPSGRPTSPWNAGPRMTWAADQYLTWQQSAAFIAPYDRWIPATFDMKVVGLVVGTLGWNGPQTTLRFDVHEEDDANGSPPLIPDFFRIDKAHLTSMPISGPGTIIRWTGLQGGGSVDIYRDNDNSGFNGTLIAADVPMGQGSYVWDTLGMPNGTYWIYLVAHDALATSRWYSLVPLVINHASPSTLFIDVPTNFWAAADINTLALGGIVGGYAESDTTVTFRPGNSSTRAQLSKMVVLSSGWSLVTPSSPTFADVPSSNPLYAFVETAAQHGVVSGYACGGPGEPCDAQSRPYFRPANNVTRAQTAKMVVVARGWSTITPSSPSFEDVAAGSPLYSFVETAVAHAIISGYVCSGPGEPCDAQNRPYYRPGNSVTRAQLSKMLARSLGAVGSEK
jgi:hypothetical protein